MSTTSSSSSGGIGFTGLLAIVFIALKLCNVIQGSWLWVLAPIWIPIVLVIVGFALYLGATAMIEKAKANAAPLRREIEELKAAIKGPVAPEPDAFEKWIRTEAPKKYSGQFIACTGPGKVIKHADTDDALMDLIADYPKKSELIIDRVPSASEAFGNLARELRRRTQK